MKINVIITSSIAAYKTPQLIRLLEKSGIKCQPILSKKANNFVTKNTLNSIATFEARDELFDIKEKEISHIKLAQETDLNIIAPATANIIAKFASGIADDLASTILLATNKPTVVFPAMNDCMWNNPATQNNINILKSRGINVLTPDIGDLACGVNGIGKFWEVEKIFEYIKQNYVTKNQPLQNLRVLVTAGGTREDIDPVRFIGNKSSGKQGSFIAKEFADLGAKVTLVGANLSFRLSFHNNIKTIDVYSSLDLQNTLIEELNHNKPDIVVMSAAVADWRAKNIETKKQKKISDINEINITLVKNIDILTSIGHSNNGFLYKPKLLVGFAAEDSNLKEASLKKLNNKNLDLIVANKITNELFGGNDNEILLITNSDITLIEKDSKQNIAKKIVTKITQMITEK